MSVLIEGMEKPKGCYECPFQGDESWCPLVEVPTPHGALIDRDKWVDEMREKLLPELTKKYGETDAFKGLHFSFLDCIENVNNADVVIDAE